MVNPTIDLIHRRKSIRAFEARAVTSETKQALLEATLRAPTAGNLMLYSIIDVQDQAARNTLAESCDHQPFIAQAPLVWLFLADYQRWMDCFGAVGSLPEPRQQPQEADLLLACCDALIAAQTTVLAAEALGLGSCYIGDIMENDAIHRRLFNLPRYTFPICLLCMGYPTEQQRNRRLTARFDSRHLVFADRYQRLSREELAAMFARESASEHDTTSGERMQAAVDVYQRKFTAAYMDEMRRSVLAMLRIWMGFDQA